MVEGGDGKTYSRAMLIKMLSVGKLFSTFPCVWSPKERNPAKAMAKHAAMLMAVE